MPAQTRTKPAVFDLAGRQLDLGSELGRGGEGVVYEVRDRSDIAVKFYHKPLHAEQSAKIAAMAKFANARLLKLTAWPKEPIRVGSGAGPVAGFIMPKITGHRQAFNLYMPKLRLQEFPTASWQFLIRSAANAARAFIVVHENGHVIGDVKHDNLLVGGNATVQLVDCDSYQIMINGSRWFCPVGTPTHQPPELQNVRTYKGVVRTPNHDNFGLAVIIFQMLLMARHPFSGRFLGTGEMPMERAISEYRFAYGSNAAAMQMQRPPASLDLNGVTRDVALLFERAFSRQGSQPNGRPRADEWVRALEDLEQHLKKCAANPAHQFVDTLSNCPWCEIEAASGVPLFQVAVVGSAQIGFTIAAFWAKVSSVPNPGPPPVFPRVNGLVATLSPAAVELRQATSDAKLAGGLLALVGATSRTQSLKKEFETKAADARSRWQNLQNNWGNYTSSKDFQDLLSNLQYLRSQYDSLPQKRLQELQKLEANRYRLQLHAHLDRCRISHARITGVGVAKKDTLQSYSIETAADIVDHRVLAVPGFGPVLLSNLKRWRDQQERRFVFDPNKEVDQAAKNVVERQILAEKIDIERRLNEGLTKLTASSSHILTRRRAVLAQAQQAARDLAQAEADLQTAEQAARELAQTEADLRAAEQAARDRARAEADLRAAEQAARDLAQAEAHSRVAAAVPSTPRPARSPNVNARGINAAIFAFSVITIGGLILALNLGKGPSAVTQQQISRQVQPQQFQPPEASPVPPVQPTLPPRVDERQTSPRPEDQFSIPVPENPFQRGFVDKTEWQQWVAALTGDFRRGAEWWAGRRSLANPGSCKGTGATSQDFAFGCESAEARLTPIDKKRKSDPEYRRGWNSYSGPIKPPSAPDVHGSPVEQSTIDTPRGSETEAADRLNAQELKRLGGR